MFSREFKQDTSNQPSLYSESVRLSENMTRNIDRCCYSNKTFGKFIPDFAGKLRWFDWKYAPGILYFYPDESDKQTPYIGQNTELGEVIESCDDDGTFRREAIAIGYVHVPEFEIDHCIDAYKIEPRPGYIAHIVKSEGEVKDGDRLFLVADDLETLEYVQELKAKQARD